MYAYKGGQCSVASRDNLGVTVLQVGVTGFCQGGALSCLAAEHAPVSCAVPFYGYPKSHPSKVSCSLLLHSPLTCPSFYEQLSATLQS